MQTGVPRRRLLSRCVPPRSADSASRCGCAPRGLVSHGAVDAEGGRRSADAQAAVRGSAVDVYQGAPVLRAPRPHATPPHPERDTRQVAFIKSFEAVYCFLPLMVKVLFIGKVRPAVRCRRQENTQFREGSGWPSRRRPASRKPPLVPVLPSSPTRHQRAGAVDEL